MSLSKGYSAVEKEKERRDLAYEAGKLKIQDFYFPKNKKGVQSTEEEITFLTDEPINFHCHTIMEGNRPINVFCPNDDTCKLCAQGEKQRYLSAFVVFHHSPWERKVYKNNKDTGKTVTMEGNIRKLVRGASDVLTLKSKKTKKGGLVGKKCTVIKGEKSWNFDDFDESDLTLQEMLDTLNDSQREEFVTTGAKGKISVDWDKMLEVAIINNEEYAEAEEKAEAYEEEMESNVRKARPEKSESKSKSGASKPKTTLKKLRK